MSIDIKFIRLDQKQIGSARQASQFLYCFWSRLINLIPKDTNMVSLFINLGTIWLIQESQLKRDILQKASLQSYVLMAKQEILISELPSQLMEVKILTTITGRLVHVFSILYIRHILFLQQEPLVIVSGTAKPPEVPTGTQYVFKCPAILIIDHHNILLFFSFD